MKTLIIALCVGVLFAAGCAQKASPDDLKYARFLFIEGIKLENTGNRLEAARSYRASLEKYPMNTEARLRLVAILSSDKKYDEAVDVINDASEEKCWKETQAGIVRYRQGDPQKALALFEAAIAANKAFPTPYYFAGIIYAANNEPSKARQFLERYRSLYPRSPDRRGEENHLIEAECAIIRIDYPAEAEAYIEALERFNTDHHKKALAGLASLSSPPALTLRARIHRCAGNNAKAVRDLKTAGDYLPARLFLAEILSQSTEGRDEAITIAKEILARESDNQRANYLMARMLSDSNRDAEARPYYEKAAAVGADDTIALEAKEFLNVTAAPVKGLSTIVEEYNKRIVKDSKEHRRLQSILRRTIKAVPGGVEVPITLSLYRGPSREINALSVRDTDAGYVYVSDDLVRYVDSLPIDRQLADSVLACVIGHEITHIAARHSRQAYSLTGILMSGTIIAGREEKEIAAASLNQAHEFEADRQGSMYAYCAGYNPYTARYFYTSLIRDKGDIPKNRDHPTFRERVAMIDALMAEIKSSYAFFRKGADALAPRVGELPHGADARLARAEKSFRAFLKAFPENGPALNNMGLVYLQKALAGTVKPRYNFATQVAMSPGLVDPAALEEKSKRRTRGKNERGSKKLKARSINQEALKKAREFLERSLKYDRDNAAALNNLGIVLAYQGKRKEALDIFQRILDRQANHANALNNAGVSEMMDGRSSSGMKRIRKASSLGLVVARKNMRGL